MIKRTQRKSSDLERLLKKALVIMGEEGAGVRVQAAYLPDREMRRLARIFLGERKKNIDVLAFPEERTFPHPDAKGRRPLGDIYVREGLRGESATLKGFFLIHGLLHLFGYTHDGKRDTMMMEGLEKTLFKKIFPAFDYPWPMSRRSKR